MRSPFVLALVCLGFASVANAQDKAQLQAGGRLLPSLFDQGPPPGWRNLRHTDHVDCRHNGRNLPSATIPWGLWLNVGRRAEQLRSLCRFLLMLSRLLIKLVVLGAFFFPLSGALRGANNPR